MRVRPPGIPRPPRPLVWGIAERLIVLTPQESLTAPAGTITKYRYQNHRWFSYASPWWVTKSKWRFTGRNCPGGVTNHVRLAGAVGGDSFRVTADGGSVRITVEYETDAPHGHRYANGEFSKNVANGISVPTIIGGYRVTSAIVTMTLYPPRDSSGRFKCGDGIKTITAGGRRQQAPNLS